MNITSLPITPAIISTASLSTDKAGDEPAGEETALKVGMVEPGQRAENLAAGDQYSQDRQDGDHLQLAGQIRELAQLDREVRTHERIHAALAGPYGGAPQFQFRRGPDGVLYAVSGHISIDLSPLPGNPEGTLRKAQTIKRAALGPSDPSSTDRAVAAKASSMAIQASAEMAKIASLENLARGNPDPLFNGFA